MQHGLAGAFQQSGKWSMFARFVDDLPALPQRFTYGGVDYKAIYDGDGNFAEVTFPSGEMYRGAITIPATINYEGLEYTVRGFDNTDGMSPFVGNPLITSLTLELNIERLRAMLFMGCTSLEHLQLPSTLRHIDSECFRNCPMLKQITLPASIETLGDNAFCGCQYLTDIYCYAMTPPEGSNTDSYPFAQCRPQNVTLHVRLRARLHIVLRVSGPSSITLLPTCPMLRSMALPTPPTSTPRSHEGSRQAVGNAPHAAGAAGRHLLAQRYADARRAASEGREHSVA